MTQANSASVQEWLMEEGRKRLRYKALSELFQEMKECSDPDWPLVDSETAEELAEMASRAAAACWQPPGAMDLKQWYEVLYQNGRQSWLRLVEGEANFGKAIIAVRLRDETPLDLGGE